MINCTKFVGKLKRDISNEHDSNDFHRSCLEVTTIQSCSAITIKYHKCKYLGSASTQVTKLLTHAILIDYSARGSGLNPMSNKNVYVS